MTNEAQFCEDYTVRFILMYNIIDKDELEDIETTKVMKEDSIYQMMLTPEKEKPMLEEAEKEYEESIGKLLDEIRRNYPGVINQTIMQLNGLLIQNPQVAAKLGLRVPQSISQGLPSLDYYNNYKKCFDNLQKLEVLGMK